jgi:hypothetical protein
MQSNVIGALNNFKKRRRKKAVILKTLPLLFKNQLHVIFFEK